MDHGIFLELLIILSASLAVIALFHRFGLPPTLGYLGTGLLLGQLADGVFHDPEAIQHLAEFGVVFLLFSLGLEFSVARMIAMRRFVFGLGASQVGITVLLLFVGALLFGLSPAGAFVAAGALAFSSTAIVIKELGAKRQLHVRFGQLTIAVLLFQDLAAVLFLVAVPALAGGGEGLALSLGVMLLKAIVLFVVLLGVGATVLPRLFQEVARMRSEELFVLAALVVVLLTAGLTAALGLSMALGAFLAGMTLGESRYRHQIEAEIRPFRDVLLGIFFVSIGLLVDLSLLGEHVGLIVLLTLSLMALKVALVAAATRLLGESLDTGLRAGIALSQGGEFGLAILALAGRHALLPPIAAAAVPAAIILSMALTPVLLRYGLPLVSRLTGLRRSGPPPTPNVDALREQVGELEAPVIICGYGRVGQAVGRFLKQEEIPSVALDADPVRIQEAAGAGENAYFGDCRNLTVLKAVGLERARLLVVAFNDHHTAQTVLERVRTVRADLPILVRTADDTGLASLRAAGATEVVPETLEGSLMLISHVLTMLGVPAWRIRDRVQAVRAARYQLLHGYYHGERSRVIDEQGRPLEALHAITLPDDAWAIGKLVGELALETVEVNLQAVRRDKTAFEPPQADLALAGGDVLVLRGGKPQIEQAERHLLLGEVLPAA